MTDNLIQINLQPYKTMKNITLLLFLVLLASCASKVHKTDIDENLYYWEGTYVGEEVKINGYTVERRLTLKEDSTFELFVETKGISKPNIQRYRGDFELDITGNTLDLQGLKTEGIHDTFYEIKSGSVLTSFEGRYKLKKAFSNQLTDSLWYLSSLYGEQVSVVLDDESASPTIKFENDGHVSVITKCGYYNGEFDIDDNGLVTVDNINETKTPCKTSVLGIAYITMLSSKFSYAIEGDEMTFMSKDGDIIAKFVK